MRHTSLVITSMLLLSACGQSQKDSDDGNPAVKAPAAAAPAPAKDAAPDAKPVEQEVDPDESVATMLVVRTASGPNGEEMLESAETRAVTEAEKIESGAEAEKIYGKGKPVAYGPQQSGPYQSGQEQTSQPPQSRHSRYTYWHTPWYPGKWLGRGRTWGRNPYVSYGGNDYQYTYNDRYFFNGYYYRYYTL